MLTTATFSRQMNLMAMPLFNAKKRMQSEYAALSQEASPKLELKGTRQVLKTLGAVFSRRSIVNELMVRHKVCQTSPITWRPSWTKASDHGGS